MIKSLIKPVSMGVHYTGASYLCMSLCIFVLQGYHALSMKHDKPTEEVVTVTEERRQFDLPELLHNLDLLVEMAESEVIQNDKK